MTVKLLTEHHLGFLSFKGGCRGSSESTHQNAAVYEAKITVQKYFVEENVEFHTRCLCKCI